MEQNSTLNDMPDFSKLKVPDLKKELKIRGLLTGGNKTELSERLYAATKMRLDKSTSDDLTDEQVDDLDDDLLNDDDSDHDTDNLVHNESVLNEIDDLDVSPINVVVKRPLEKDAESEPKPLKKLILNRKPSVTTELKIEEPKQPTVTPTAKSITNIPEVAADDKKVIKLNSLNAKERLEMRAKKFGAPASVEAKKVARLERFGTDTTAVSATTAKANCQLDVLKKRAERFGGSVSKAMSGLEQKERLELRKARFGNLATTCVSENDKAKQRLERFKTPAN